MKEITTKTDVIHRYNAFLIFLLLTVVFMITGCSKKDDTKKKIEEKIEMLDIINLESQTKIEEIENLYEDYSLQEKEKLANKVSNFQKYIDFRYEYAIYLFDHKYYRDAYKLFTSWPTDGEHNGEYIDASNSMILLEMPSDGTNISNIITDIQALDDFDANGNLFSSNKYLAQYKKCEGIWRNKDNDKQLTVKNGYFYLNLGEFDKEGYDGIKYDILINGQYLHPGNMLNNNQTSDMDVWFEGDGLHWFGTIFYRID